jgi:hypothetical protein
MYKPNDARGEVYTSVHIRNTPEIADNILATLNNHTLIEVIPTPKEILDSGWTCIKYQDSERHGGFTPGYVATKNLIPLEPPALAPRPG